LYSGLLCSLPIATAPQAACSRLLLLLLHIGFAFVSVC
jgi:hypothetical protein